MSLRILFTRRSGAGKQRLHGFHQPRQAGLDHTPDDPIIHRGIAVHQNVSERDNPAKVVHLRGDGRICLSKPCQGLPDDPELALDGGLSMSSAT